MTQLPRRGPSLQTWREVEIGGIGSFAEYSSAIQHSKQRCLVRSINELIPMSPIRKKIKLVSLTVEQLSGTNYSSYRAGLETGKKLGLLPCPAEVGLALRLIYTDQPRGEECFLMMEPLGEDGEALAVVHRRGNSPFVINWLASKLTLQFQRLIFMRPD